MEGREEMKQNNERDMDDIKGAFYLGLIFILLALI